MAKLRPRARIIRTVGDQLISGPEAALIELVKNAYDADSPSVTIRIVPPNEDLPGGLICVQDFGHGMTLETVTNGWFEPATDDKLKRRYSPGGRRLLGAKGIGRFATSRLGTQTRLRSITKDGNG
ncbi:MAG: ATP-binding protein, partial [Paraburkholderia tropica]